MVDIVRKKATAPEAVKRLESERFFCSDSIHLIGTLETLRPGIFDKRKSKDYRISTEIESDSKQVRQNGGKAILSPIPCELKPSKNSSDEEILTKWCWAGSA